MDGILIVMSGFSGAGKGTLLHRLLNDYDDFAFSVSMTTRSPREGEVDGKDYFFVTKEKFEEAIKDGLLYEHATYCDNYYGTPREYVDSKLKEGKSVILDIEVQGAMQIKEKFPDTLLVFVTPPSISELKRRLENRGTESPETIAKRITRAKEESKWIDKYEYIVLNDDLDTAVKEMHDIVLAQRYQTKRCGAFIKEIQNELLSY
jgi:guanylate kinase